MNTSREIAKLKSENRLLKSKLRITKSALIFVIEEIEELKNSFDIRFFDAIEGVKSEYSILLFPPSIKVNTFKNKHEFYDIRINDILWVESNGRMKQIFLNKSMTNNDGINKTDRISISTDKLNFEKLIKILDPTSIHLSRVSRTFILNVGYFKLNGISLELSKKQLNSFGVPMFKTKLNTKKFKADQQKFINLFSFHKKASRSKL